MATYSSHRLIMGKEEIDNFFCLIEDILIFFAMATYSSHRLIMGKVEISLNIFISFYQHTCTTWNIVQYNRIGTKAMVLVWFLSSKKWKMTISAKSLGIFEFFLYRNIY